MFGRLGAVRNVFFAMLFAASALFAQSNNGEETFTELMSQKEFPVKVRIDVEGQTFELTATGATVMEREGQNLERLSVYVIAHYMGNFKPDPLKDVYEQLIKARVPKQLEFVLLRQSTAKQVQGGIRRLFERAIRNEGLAEGSFQKELEVFSTFFTRDYDEGDRVIFRWIPEDRFITVLPDGSQKEIRSAEFAELFWRLWFGLMSPVDRGSLTRRISLY